MYTFSTFALTILDQRQWDLLLSGTIGLGIGWTATYIYHRYYIWTVGLQMATLIFHFTPEEQVKYLADIRKTVLGLPPEE